jgi:hypothetical protein
VISPDGRSLAFSARASGGVRHLRPRGLDSLEAKVLPDAESAGRVPGQRRSSTDRVRLHQMHQLLEPSSGGNDNAIFFADASNHLMRVPASGVASTAARGGHCRLSHFASGSGVPPVLG